MKKLAITKGGSVKFDNEKLTKLIGIIPALAQLRTRVGVLGPKVARHDAGRRNTEGALVNPQNLNNAEIGLKNEFGCWQPGYYSAALVRIPERSFLRMPLLYRLPKVLNNDTKTAWVDMMIADGPTVALQRLGAAGEHVVQEAFHTHGFGQWEPNAPLTVRLKGSMSPLIDNGELRQAITSDVVKATP